MKIVKFDHDANAASIFQELDNQKFGTKEAGYRNMPIVWISHELRKIKSYGPNFFLRIATSS